jgi:GNAT superfamily N-acetyltransferase
MAVFTIVSNNCLRRVDMDEIIEDIQFSDIYAIKSCWEDLNKIHEEDSIYYKDHYKNFTFEQRIESFGKIENDNIKITVVRKDGEVAGYCISSVKDSTGEIESLYLKPELRKHDFGRLLVESHKAWLKSKKCKKIKVTVSYGHDSVLKFYNKMGFFERLIELELKD